MQTLHILRSQPDETVATLKKSFSDQGQKTVALYDGDTDWKALVEAIFEAEKVVSWW
jgi:hypothetical protein